MSRIDQAAPLPGVMPDLLPENAPAPDFDPKALAKSLLRATRAGSLATIDRNTGHPFASLVNVATDSDGAPVILISRLATHTANLEADGRASVLLSLIHILRRQHQRAAHGAEALHRHRDRNNDIAAVVDAHHASVLAVEGLRHFGIASAIVRAELMVERQIAPAEPHAHGDESALEKARPFLGRRRQIEAQHVAAAEQIAAVDQQHAVTEMCIRDSFFPILAVLRAAAWRRLRRLRVPFRVKLANRLRRVISAILFLQ